MICIYELVCPIGGQVRYVGKTSKPLSIRLSQHISEARRHVPNIGRRGDWIRFLLKQELRPLIRVALELVDDADWKQAERGLIAHYRSLGADIINGTEGGDGMSNPTLEWRMAQADRVRGRKQSAETKAKRSVALKGRPKSAEWRAKASAAAYRRYTKTIRHPGQGDLPI